MKRFQMFPTIVTPFNADGSINYQDLEGLVDHFARAGCDGVFAVCQSSEMFFLGQNEQLALAEKTLAFCRARGMRCVVSGHTQDSLDEQIAYLKKLEKLRPDAIILVNNRLAAQEEPELLAVQNLKRICGNLNADTCLGVYECPYPYKRPLTAELIEAMIADGRFRFIKDTSCRIEEIRRRLALVTGSGIELYNANAATLLESMEAGAAGYSGIQLNIMPEYFSLFKDAWNEQEEAKMQLIAQAITAASVIEFQNYPANAKYGLMKRGIFHTCITRNGKPPMSESQQKEMDAFLAMLDEGLARLQPHAPSQLLFDFDRFFPECHASTVLPLSNGRVLCAYFAGAREKADDVGIWLSVFDGKQWQAPRCIFKICQEPHWNPVLFLDGDTVRIVFKAGKEIPQWRSYASFSTDGGSTWAPVQPFALENSAGGPVRCKPLVLADGRMLAPASDETAESWLPRIDESLDGGKTFHRLASIPLNREAGDQPNYLEGLGAIQPTLWESAPGQVHAFLRTTGGSVYRSDSADGGKTWSAAAKTALPNNNSGIDIAKAGKSLYLVMNPVAGNWAARTPLVVMRSVDNGVTFHQFAVLEDTLLDMYHHRSAEFSYPAIVYAAEKLHITFTYMRKSIAYAAIKVDAQ